MFLIMKSSFSIYCDLVRKTIRNTGLYLQLYSIYLYNFNNFMRCFKDQK